MEGFRTRHPMVRGSNPGLCSFTTYKNIALCDTVWHREILALHLRVEGINTFLFKVVHSRVYNYTQTQLEVLRVVVAQWNGSGLYTQRYGVRIPVCVLFSTLENKGLRGSLWQREILALHLVNNLRVEVINTFLFKVVNSRVYN